MSSYISDRETDSIDLSDSYFSGGQLGSITMDTLNNKWSGYIQNNDVYNRAGGHGQLGPAYTIVAKDTHYGTDKTDSASVEQKIYLYYNQSPYVSNPVPDQTTSTGNYYEYVFAANTFAEPDNEVMTYSWYCTPNCAWMSVDLNARKLSGTPSHPGDAGVYSVNLVASDPNPNSGDATDSFTLTVTTNQQPEQDQGLYIVPQNISVFQEFSYFIPVDAFKDDEDDDIILSFTIDPGNVIPDYDLTTRTVSWTLDDNSAFGTYTLTVSANDAVNSADLPYTESVNFEYMENHPPQILAALADPN